MKKVIILITALLAFATAQAQDSCKVCKPYLWEAGIPIGLTQYYGDLHCSQPYKSTGSNFHVGAFVRRHISDYFALRGQVLLGRMTANDYDQPDGYWDYRGFRMTTPLTELSLLGEFYPLKERRFTCDGNCRKTLSPYIFAGVGAALTNPKITVDNPNSPLFSQRLFDEATAGGPRRTSVVFPLGIGAKYNATERFTIGAEMGYRFSTSDFIDGMSYAAYSKKKDGYFIPSLLASYRFGDKDSDKDGVVDRCDICPSEKGLRKFQGCPDTDGDGIPDKDDACPTQPGPMSLKGCPDTDGDGIADKDDECPTLVGTAALKGCPDKDGDGVADKDDACPDVAGIKALKGCPDSDGDGIADKDDACPNAAGPASLNGCPDTDGDGIADKDDACPNVAGLAQFKGCPDKDGDGIPDNVDQCPDTKGTAANNGCPETFKGYRTASGCEISEAELGDLTLAAQGIEFYAGTNKLKPSSYKSLDRVCAVMKRCPDAMLNITTSGANARLAKLRACSVYAYFLKKKCITKARMTYDGLGGESGFTNAQGKKVDSRTEFQLR
ncbi:MAG: DUF6089 family protein [Spirosomataceae bacterium]